MPPAPLLITFSVATLQQQQPGNCRLQPRGYAHQLNPQFLVEREGLKARVLDGKKLANTIKGEIQEEIKKMLAEGKRYVTPPPHPLFTYTQGY